MYESGYWSDYFENGFWLDTSSGIPPVVDTTTVFYGTLIEIDFSTGTRYYSFQGVSSPSAWYKNAVLSVGSINREVPYLGGEYRVADTEIVLANIDKEFSMLKADVGFRNRTVRIRFGNLRAGLAQMQSVYTGKITNWSIAQGRIQLEVRDASYERFRIDVSGRLNRTAFPNLPVEQELKLYPIIYGTVSSALHSATGALPTYLVDPAVGGAVYRYVVARHICKQVLNVYRYGELLAPSAYTVTTTAVDGYTMTFLDFSTDQRDDARSGELEITVDVLGTTSDGTPAGSLITNPVEQLKHYPKTYAGLVDADFSTNHVANAQQNMDAASYQGSWAVVEDTTHEEIINKFNESFNGSLFTTRYGLYAPFFFFIDDLTDVEASTSKVTDEDDILRDSFEIYPIEDVASRLQYNFQWNYVKQYFERQPDVVSGAQETILGLDVRQNVNLWFVGFEPTAQNVAADRLYDLREVQQFIRFALPVTAFTVELNDYLRVTHFQGIKASGAGYERAVFRVIGLSLELQPQSMQVRATCVKLFDSDDVWAQYMRLGDESTMSSSWLTASADDKTYLYLADEADLTGGPGGTLGTADAGKLLW